MWPFTEPYPNARIEDVAGQTFDYVIVGGGTAGCLLASRLSSTPNTTVLVLEKGHVSSHFLSRTPLLSQNFAFPFLQVLPRVSEPVTSRLGGNRRARMWTAEAVGGASRINGMLLTRGVPAGYDEWAEECGLRDWSWEKCEPFFRKSENAVGHPGAKHRGHEGPVENRQVRPSLGCLPYIERTAERVGLTVERDVNDPRGSAQGYFYLDMCIDGKGKRVSAYDAWLNGEVARERREWLSVCTGVVASRIEVAEGERKRATGVWVRRRGTKEDLLVKVRREVIVCSGAVCSPQLLLMSGIGPRHELDRNAIPVIHDLPAVGQNLADHVAVPVMMEMPRKDTLHSLESLLGALWHLFLYLFLGIGILASSSTTASFWVRSSALDPDTMTVQREDEKGSTMDAMQIRNIPDVEIMINPVNCLTEVVPGKTLFSWFATLVQPMSKGRIELASRDPEDSPRIEYPFLTDERDAVPLRKAARFSMRLAEEFAKSGYPHPSPLVFAPGMDLEYLDAIFEPTKSRHADIREAVPDRKRAPGLAAPVPGGKVPMEDCKEKLTVFEHIEHMPTKRSKKLDWRTVTDVECDAYMRRVWLSSLHLTGTCRMSLSPDDGVVDQQLKVHGFENLRVADASVFPKIPSCHTMAPTMMVAERCAEFVRGEWEWRKTQ